jgi:hypothetical protein
MRDLCKPYDLVWHQVLVSKERLVATEILPAPADVPVVEGEVIDPMDTLKANERVIRNNLKKFEAAGTSIARALNVIYHNDLWKLHKTAEGKRRYTNFNDYLATEFGWEKSAARARQIMKADLPLAIEAGDVPSEVGDKRRERTAPEISAVKAAQVTRKQLETVTEAWVTRMQSVEGGDALGKLSDIYDAGYTALTDIQNALTAFIDEQEAEAEVAPKGDDDK